MRNGNYRKVSAKMLWPNTRLLPESISFPILLKMRDYRWYCFKHVCFMHPVDKQLFPAINIIYTTQA